MPKGWLAAVGTSNSVMTPAGVIRPIRLPEFSVNHRLPSGPGAIAVGPLPAVGSGNSVVDRVCAPALETGPHVATQNATAATARAPARGERIRIRVLTHLATDIPTRFEEPGNLDPRAVRVLSPHRELFPSGRPAPCRKFATHAGDAAANHGSRLLHPTTRARKGAPAPASEGTRQTGRTRHDDRCKARSSRATDARRPTWGSACQRRRVRVWHRLRLISLASELGGDKEDVAKHLDR